MALTLSKVGISQNNVIEASHVTQSIDALTGTEAYDITISGSLVVDGPVTGSSFTGSFIGNANLTGSYTGSFFGDASLTGSYTGSFTGSLLGNATTSTYILDPFPNYMPKPGATFVGPGSLGMLAGSITLTSGISPAINPSILNGKTFQQDYWVTATKASGSTSPTAATLFTEELSPGGGSFFIKEVGASSNDDVNFIIIYLQ